ncbi:MAG: hypothetical protein IRY90_22155, partial [Actinomadura rubrobrunea]|nr:hypothetical protein [Actinomadura rubrobrunea]
MAGVPYRLPAAEPDESGRPASPRSGVDDLAARLAVHEEVYGVPLDGFSGSDDDAKLRAALSYAAAQTRPPAIVLANRAHRFDGGPYPYYDGLRLVGSLGTLEREFASAGPQCVATVGGSALFSVPRDGVRNMFITGVQFRAASGRVHFQTPLTDFAKGPIVQDADFRGLAWVGFKTVMHARHLRCSIERVYVNNGTDTQFKLAGSDNYYFVEGKSFMSARALKASMFYLWFTHMSRTQVGPIYITPEVATAVRIDGSYGDLVFTGTLFDCTGRSASTACQGAAVLITGGKGMVFR